MKLIIAGSRTYSASIRDILKILVISGIKRKDITEIVSGGAKGIDASGERFARRFNIPLKVFKADWEKYGKAAGPKRNKQMAKYADTLLIIWDGTSRGSASMKRQAANYGLLILESIVHYKP